MYTYVQRPGCKKENTATYVHTGGVSNAYSRIRMTRACVHGWVRTECVVVFIERAWTEQPMKTRPGVPQNRGNGLVFDRPRSKWDPVHREGSSVPQNGGNGPPTSKRGPVDREGCGVPQNRQKGLVLERYGQNGCHTLASSCIRVLFMH